MQPQTCGGRQRTGLKPAKRGLSNAKRNHTGAKKKNLTYDRARHNLNDRPLFETRACPREFSAQTRLSSNASLMLGGVWVGFFSPNVVRVSGFYFKPEFRPYPVWGTSLQTGKKARTRFGFG